MLRTTLHQASEILNIEGFGFLITGRGV